MQEEAVQNRVRIVAVKFRPAGKQYDFNALDYQFQSGDRVVVETDRGRALGTVAQPPRETEASLAPEDLKKVIRPASDEDIALSLTNAAREKEAHRYCLQRIQERQMEMKLVRAEYLFDGSKIIFYFTADGRVDFRELVKDLAHHFHTRIEMRQIGVRDEAKLIGGIGICGRELCCCTFLTEFAPVSVKMAKEQGLALNPTKISGQCGRLLCCLAYEFETYCSLKKGLPKCGSRVRVEGKEGDVVDQNVLCRKLTVRFEDGTRQVSADEVTAGGGEGPASPSPRTTPPPSREGKSRPQSRRGREEGGQKPPHEAAGPKASPPSTREDLEKQGGPGENAEQARKKNRRRRPRGRRRPQQNQPQSPQNPPEK